MWGTQPRLLKGRYLGSDLLDEGQNQDNYWEASLGWHFFSQPSISLAPALDQCLPPTAQGTLPGHSSYTPGLLGNSRKPPPSPSIAVVWQQGVVHPPSPLILPRHRREGRGISSIVSPTHPDSLLCQWPRAVFRLLTLVMSFKNEIKFLKSKNVCLSAHQVFLPLQFPCHGG